MIIVLSEKSSCILSLSLCFLVLITTCTFIRAAACWRGPVEYTLNDSCSAAAPVSHIKQNCSLRTVLFTSTAFHTKIPANDTNPFVYHLKNFMWAYLYTHSTIIALLLDQLERDNLGIISESLHGVTFL